MASKSLAAFGSPSAARRPAPNIAFIIDTGPCFIPDSEGVLDMDAFERNIKIAVLRLLLFFYIHVDTRFSWSYQLVDLNSISTLQATKGSICHSQDFNPLTLDAFNTVLKRELNKRRVDEAINPRPSLPHTPPIKRISMILRKALTDFRWNWVSASAVMPSPAKPPRRDMNSSVPVKLRNYLFLLSPFPQTAQELDAYAGIMSRSPEGETHCSRNDSTLSKSTIARIDEALDVMQREMLTEGMLNGYLEKRTAISWVELPLSFCETSAQSAHTLEASYIECSLTSMLSAYGGNMIPRSVLITPPTALPFAQLFRLFRKKTLDPKHGHHYLSVGCNNRMKDLQRSLGRSLPTQNNEMWTGNIFTTANTEARKQSGGIYHIVISACVRATAPPEKSSNTRGKKRFSVGSHTSNADPTPSRMLFPNSGVAMKEKGRIPFHRIDPSWQEREMFICAPFSAGEFGTAFLSFESLMTLLRSESRALVVEVHLRCLRNRPEGSNDANENKKVAEESSAETAGIGAEDDNPFEVASPLPANYEEQARLAILFPVFPGCALLRVVSCGSEETVLDDCNSSLISARVSSAQDVDETLLQQWFSNSLEDEIQAFFFSGKSSREIRDFLGDMTLNIWDPQMEDERLRGKCDERKSLVTSPKATSPLPPRDTPRKPKRNPELSRELRRMGDVTDALRRAYLDTLYCVKSAVPDFIEVWLPHVYQSMEKIATNISNSLASPLKPKSPRGVGRTPTKVLLTYICDHILLSVARLEQKYRAFMDGLDILDDTADASPSLGKTVDTLELEALLAWKSQLVSNSTIPMESSNGRRILKDAISKLKISEAKLQLTMLLECLKIHDQTGQDLPSLAAWFKRPEPDEAEAEGNLKRKKRKSLCLPDATVPGFRKKRKVDRKQVAGVDEMPEPNNVDHNGQSAHESGRTLFTRAIDELMDRICIWHAVAGLELESEETRLLKSFVEPIIVKYYASHLPDVVKSLYVKAGGDPNQQKPVPPSPFFKQKSTGGRKRGSGMAGHKKHGSSAKSTDKAKPKDKIIPHEDILNTDETDKPRATRKLPEFLKGLGRRQIALRKARSKEANRKALKDNSTNAAPLERSKSTSAATASSLRRTSDQENRTVILKRRSTSAQDTFGLPSKPLQTGSLDRIDDNPFLDLSSTLPLPKPPMLSAGGDPKATTSDIPERSHANTWAEPRTPSKQRRAPKDTTGTPTKTRRTPRTPHRDALGTPSKTKRAPSATAREAVDTPSKIKQTLITTPRKTVETPIKLKRTPNATPRKTAGTPSKVRQTPSATPGSCKRLQMMLEGFAGFDWDELGEEIGGVADTPIKSRKRW
ncbi:uncharacterized protein SPPG_05195 [Spizellomyces punctatus DAOM BR117]|uniref:DNA replication regulator Sld3 C-terminal domain-containing protein n=1 Tax=Spizellomyces punctatus (strain DAOM BR117) TaxID=645134 RepID=A0A0L0HEC8_SPIPD|nr:uncharacterized protein SPPG_05195 [Spizellomyces punctatus DAOM BR117]KNC99820.1 hypothetical protein SPPG_05195 [Spizellomyces punctatus DAOM BR117]|eukprot:XP_016607860.1 hypothetical protein SPPG_05195 [Spizellomyces punctatus DAOM BR117]